MAAERGTRNVPARRSGTGASVSESAERESGSVLKSAANGAILSAGFLAF